MRRGMEHPSVENVRAARQEFLDWRANFPDMVKKMRAAQREWYLVRMEDAVLAMYEAGASVRHIMEVYGTTDNRIINRMIRTAQLRRGDTLEEPKKEPRHPSDAVVDSLDQRVESED